MSISESLSFYLSSATANTAVVSPIEIISNTTPSTSTNTGALVVAGGVGIAGTLTVGGGMNFNGVYYSPTSFTPQGFQTLADGASASFALSFTPPSLTSLIVTIDGLVEYDYTISGNNLTFGFIPDVNSIIRVFCFGVSGPTGTITPGSVTSSSFAPGAIVGGLGYTPVASTVSSVIAALGYTPLSATATSAQYLANSSASAALSPAGVWAAAAPTPVADSSPITLNLSTGINFSILLTTGIGATRQLANPNNIKPGQTGWISVTQSASGNNAITFGNQWHFSTGTITTVSNTANAVDLIYYTAVSSSYLLTTIAKQWF